MSGRLYIETVGCQMNVLDSEMIVASLRKRGYEVVTDVQRCRRHSLQHLQRAGTRRGKGL